MNRCKPKKKNQKTHQLFIQTSQVKSYSVLATWDSAKVYLISFFSANGVRSTTCKEGTQTHTHSHKGQGESVRLEWQRESKNCYFNLSRKHCTASKELKKKKKPQRTTVLKVKTNTHKDTTKRKPNKGRASQRERALGTYPAFQQLSNQRNFAWVYTIVSLLCVFRITATELCRKSLAYKQLV